MSIMIHVFCKIPVAAIIVERGHEENHNGTGNIADEHELMVALLSV